MVKGRDEGRAWTMVAGDELMAVPIYTRLNGSNEEQALAVEALRLTRELRVLLGQYVMYEKLTRDREFGEACDRSAARNGLAILIGALLRTIVISTAAIFDRDQKTTNIKKIILRSMNKPSMDFLGRMHASEGNTNIFEESRERLTKYRRRLNKGKLQEAIARLIHVRNTMVAHFDASPSEFPRGQRALVGDVRYVVAAATIIVSEANVLILARAVAFPPLREVLREDTRGFKAALMAGFQVPLLDRRPEGALPDEPEEAELIARPA